MEVRHKWKEFLKSKMWRVINGEQGRAKERSGIGVSRLIHLVELHPVTVAVSE